MNARRTPAASGSGHEDVEPFPSLQPSTSAAHSITPSLNSTYNPYGPPVTFGASVNRRPISIRRLSSTSTVNTHVTPRNSLLRREDNDGPPSREPSGRTRATSAPLNTNLAAPGVGAHSGTPARGSALSPLQEENTANVPQDKLSPSPDAHHSNDTRRNDGTPSRSGTITGRLRSASNAARSVVSRISDPVSDHPMGHQYDAEVVDLLDVLDPEVATLTTLNNVQNSLFIPDLGKFLNRRPTYALSSSRANSQQDVRQPGTHRWSMRRRGARPTDGEGLERYSTVPELPSHGISRVPSRNVTRVPSAPARPSVPDIAVTGATPQQTREEIRRVTSARGGGLQAEPAGRDRSMSITSEVLEEHYAVLPHGVSLDGWSEEDKIALDDHVRHMLHSKRSKFVQKLKAFGKYISKPLGFFVTLYATLITIFGLVWVLFLIGWLSGGSKHKYDIDVVDNVLVALFAIMGDGLAPFRAVDTYHMIYIARYHRLSWKLRKRRQLPDLPDRNDLPDKHEKEVDPESGKAEDGQFSVLSPHQQRKLNHHAAKFARSHSYYKPHETYTHHAFPLNLLIIITVLLDCHSLLQITLGTVTWSINYHTRPQAATAAILCCSITCNIMAGVVIAIGDRKTRKKDVIERIMRQRLTEEALKKVEKQKADRERQDVEEREQQEELARRQQEVADRVDRDVMQQPLLDPSRAGSRYTINSRAPSESVAEGIIDPSLVPVVESGRTVTTTTTSGPSGSKTRVQYS